MVVDVWLNRSGQLLAGAELYRSERNFTWWDYTPSHGQLLLRSEGRDGETRIDVLFKGVAVMKVRSRYNGLRIRCATPAEQDRIHGDTPEITYYDPSSNKFDQGSRYFVLGADGGFDYVVAQGVGWHEDHHLGEPSYFADPSGGSAPWSPRSEPRWAQTALDGVNGGLSTPMATVDELVDAIATAGNIPAEDRTRYRYIYVVIGLAFVPEPHAFGAFLTRTEAEQQRQRLADRFPDSTFTIDAIPIGI